MHSITYIVEDASHDSNPNLLHDFEIEVYYSTYAPEPDVGIYHTTAEIIDWSLVGNVSVHNYKTGAVHTLKDAGKDFLEGLINWDNVNERIHDEL